jgi:asparagine synthase (glutamine-hydrolysing)
VDLPGGRQPLANEDGTVWVAFNGELFEYPELFAELSARGHRLVTRCDTEIWVHLWEEHGAAMLDRARGQFAVSLWDARQRTLMLARDRIGICPLYYTEVDGWLLWASEIKALLASGLVPIRPDPRGIDHFISFICAGTTRTFFDGLRSLAPGQTLTVRDGRISLQRYWDLDFPDAGHEQRGSPGVLTDELEALLRQAIRRRLRGDVPVVSYLSGGVDSSTVLALAQQEASHPVRAFTIGLADAGHDESQKARALASHLGVPLSVLTMSRSDIADAYPALIVAAEGPVLDTSSACMVRLAARVHEEGYKVALTGEGADEALAGYEWFKLQKIQSFLGWPLRRWAFSRGRGGLSVVSASGTRQRTPFAAMAGVRTAQQGIYELLGQARERLYSDAMWGALSGHSPFDDLNLPTARMSRWHPINQASYVDFKVFLPGLLLLAKGDRSAMHSSVETRPPFLDEDVVDFCARLHPDYKLRGFREKWLLRRLASRVLPSEVANRPKHGFRAQLAGTFLRPGRPPWVDQLLSVESLEKTGFFEPAAVARERDAIEQHWRRLSLARLRADVGLTAVIATQLWYHVFCGGGLADLPTWSPPAGE